LASFLSLDFESELAFSIWNEKQGIMVKRRVKNQTNNLTSN
jgi:hypothetical protein